MPGLPYGGLSGLASPGTIQAPDDYQRIQADPNAFGAGIAQAEQGLGQKVEQAGGVGLDIAIHQQVFANSGAVTNALTNAQQASMNAQYGDPDKPGSQGFYALKGKQAVDAYGATIQTVKDGYQAARDSLDNDAQRQTFDRQSRRTMMSTLATMGQHNALQTRAFAQDAQSSLIQTSLQAAGHSYTNDDGFKQGLSSALDAQKELDAQQGLPAETMQQHALALTSKAYGDRALRLGADNPSAGMDFLRSNAGQLDETTQTAILNHLRPQVDRQQGLQAGAAGMAAAGSPGGGPPVPGGVLTDVVHQLETGGSMAPGQTGDGGQAHGPMQVHGPALADVNAKLGTSYTTAQLEADPAVGKKVGAAYLGMMSDKYGRDDYALGAYNQGPGAMDTAIASGKGTAGLPGGGAQYVANGMKLLGGKQLGPDTGGYQVPDLGTALKGADAYADANNLSPEARQHAESYVVQQHSRIMAAGATERQDLTRTVSDLLPALGQGLDADIPEDRIRAAFPPEQASRMVDGLRTEQQAGTLMKGLQFAPLDQAVQTVQALQVPGSVQAGKITLRRGQLAGPGMQGSGQGADGGVIPASFGGTALGGAEDPENMRMRMQIAGRAQSLLQQRQQALSADPAGYAQQSPDVQQAFAAASQQGANPAAMGAYVASTTALQQQLGVPADKVRLLTNPQVSGLVQHITKQTPGQGDTGAQLDAMAKQYGTAWPQVFGEMVTAGKLPRDYQVLANMDQPGQVTGRQDFQRMLTFMGQKGGPKEMLADLPAGAEAGLRQGIDGVMQPFQATTMANEGGLQLSTDVRDSVMHMAAYRLATGGQTDPGRALQGAYDDVIGQKYDLDGAMRVPKGMLGDAQQATSAMQAALQPGDVAQIGGSNPAMTADDKQGAYLHDLKRSGFWVPNRDDSGLALVSPVRNSTVPQAVFRPDGSRVEMKFADMRQGAVGAPMPAAAVPSASAVPAMQ